VIVMDPDDIPGLVNVENPVCEHLIHSVVVRPPFPLRTSVGRFVLFIMKQSVQLALRVSSPSGLVLQACCAVFII